MTIFGTIEGSQERWQAKCDTCGTLGQAHEKSPLNSMGDVTDDYINRAALAQGWSYGRRGQVRTLHCPNCLGIRVQA